MNKIELVFNNLKENNKKALIPFIGIGDPSIEETIEMVVELEKAGADIIELGIPFSDPLADGTVIQNSYHRALTTGIKIHDILNCIKRISIRVNAPLVTMVYYNIVFCVGVEKFIESLREAGVSGMIIPDLPLEEKEEVEEICNKNNILLIPLVAPTSKERICKITKDAKGFVYCVSHAGTTGEQSEVSSNIKEYLQEVRNSTSTPICVGFGISSVETASAVKDFADGIIIGSAIVKRATSDEKLEDRKANVYNFTKEISKSLNLK